MYLKITICIVSFTTRGGNYEIKNIYEHFFPHLSLLGRWRDIGGMVSFKKFEPRGGGHIPES